MPSSSAVIQEKLDDFSQQARELTIAGLALLFATAFMMLVTIEKAFNEIWQVAEPRRGYAAISRVLGRADVWPAAGRLPGVVISSYLISLPLFVDTDTVGARQTLLSGLPMLFSTVGFTVLFYAMPNCRVRFRDALARRPADDGVFRRG